MKFKKKSQSPIPEGTIVPASIGLSFPEAIKYLVAGEKIRREEWSDSNEHCLLKDSYLMIYRNEKFFTWIISEGDALAKDWLVMK